MNVTAIAPAVSSSAAVSYPSLRAKQASPSGEYLVFTLSGVRFAVDLSLVTDLARLDNVYRNSGHSDEIFGFIQLSDVLAPVLDLYAIGSRPAPPAADSTVVVLEIAGVSVGILVDQIESRIQRGDFVRSASTRSQLIDENYLSGSALIEGGAIACLRPQNLLLAVEALLDF